MLFDSYIYNKLYLFGLLIVLFDSHIYNKSYLYNTLKSDSDLFKFITVYHLHYSSESLSFTLYFSEYFGSPP